MRKLKEWCVAALVIGLCCVILDDAHARIKIVYAEESAEAAWVVARKSKYMYGRLTQRAHMHFDDLGNDSGRIHLHLDAEVVTAVYDSENFNPAHAGILSVKKEQNGDGDWWIESSAGQMDDNIVDIYAR